MEKYHNIIAELQKWSKGGERVLDNGTKMICHVPHVAAQAWLHEIYSPLTRNALLNLQYNLDKKLPDDYKEFLLCSNGINLFSDSLSVWGVRTSYARRGDEAIQPYDLVDGNKEASGLIPDSMILFGSYSWDGMTMAYDLSKGPCKVFLCAPDSYEVLHEWENIWVWLSEEITRFSLLFDENGVMYDEDVPTTPII